VVQHSAGGRDAWSGGVVEYRIPTARRLETLSKAVSEACVRRVVSILCHAKHPTPTVLSVPQPPCTRPAGSCSAPAPPHIRQLHQPLILVLSALLSSVCSLDCCLVQAVCCCQLPCAAAAAAVPGPRRGAAAGLPKQPGH
jgi:hypothetical protein